MPERIDRYETLIQIREDAMIKGKYTIYEKDSTKGTRITTIDFETGVIIRETK